MLVALQFRIADFASTMTIARELYLQFCLSFRYSILRRDLLFNVTLVFFFARWWFHESSIFVWDDIDLTSISWRLSCAARFDCLNKFCTFCFDCLSSLSLFLRIVSFSLSNSSAFYNVWLLIVNRRVFDFFFSSILSLLLWRFHFRRFRLSTYAASTMNDRYCVSLSIFFVICYSDQRWLYSRRRHVNVALFHFCHV